MSKFIDEQTTSDLSELSKNYWRINNLKEKSIFLEEKVRRRLRNATEFNCCQVLEDEAKQLALAYCDKITPEYLQAYATLKGQITRNIGRLVAIVIDDLSRKPKTELHAGIINKRLGSIIGSTYAALIIPVQLHISAYLDGSMTKEQEYYIHIDSKKFPSLVNQYSHAYFHTNLQDASIRIYFNKAADWQLRRLPIKDYVKCIESLGLGQTLKAPTEGQLRFDAEGIDIKNL